MGTNYYFQPKPACESCHRDFEELHIGKSSSGWVFALRIHPDQGINTLADWMVRWAGGGSSISNEYGDVITPDEMVEIITKRTWSGNSWSPSALRENHAIRGPNGLARSAFDAYSKTKPGEGTWDYCDYEFS